MGKKKKRPNPNSGVQNPITGNAPKNSPTVAEAQKSAEQLKSDADGAAAAIDLTPWPLSDETAGSSLEAFTTSVRLANVARQTYEQIAMQLKSAKERLNDDQDRLNSERTILASDRDALKNEQKTLTDQKRNFSDELRKNEAKSEELIAREAEAEAGFLKRRDELLGPIRLRIAELTSSWHDQEMTLVSDWNSKLGERREQIASGILAQEAVLLEEENRIQMANTTMLKEKASLERERDELRTAREILEEDKRAFESNSDSRISVIEDEHKQSLRFLEERNEKLVNRNDELKRLEQDLEEINRGIGGNVTSMLRDHEKSMNRVRELENELKHRPNKQVQEELDAARQELQTAVVDRNESLRAQRELQKQLDSQQTQIMETERLQKTKLALETSIKAYSSTIEELSSQLGQMQGDLEVKSAFPECTKSDLKEREPRDGNEINDLSQFIRELQVEMADVIPSGPRLNYRLADLRIFLSGLAMSHLHILEGVSGTGKTTLPIAFALAVGSNPKTVEVQAGWRDRQDLLGYYNSFERIFRETPFLQWLYRASLKNFSDQVILIVLDEMNLSHPEQYFADFLSALENPNPAGRLISISDRGLPSVPKHMIQDTGVQLRLPPNVWFVGTANQDETTFGFAPKTYDRAHVMELQPNAREVPIPNHTRWKGSLSLNSLMGKFNEAEVNYKRDTEKANQYVRNLAPFFNEKLQVAWGERLSRDISKFVPVNIAAGGSLGEALDHILSTKVMKKVEGRHSVRTDILSELSDKIQTEWPDSDNPPSKTLKKIEMAKDDPRFG
jgi:hypothetical protein